MVNVSALNIDRLIDYFKQQKQTLDKKYYKGTGTLNDLKEYKKIINNVKNIDPKLDLDFKLVTKDTDKGSKQILYTSKGVIDDKLYQSEYQFLIDKNNKIYRIDTYRDIHDKPKQFLRGAGTRDFMLLDDNIIHALKGIISKRS